MLARTLGPQALFRLFPVPRQFLAFQLLIQQIIDHARAGLALVPFMTCPTKKALTVFLPARYCSTCWVGRR